MMIWRRVDLGVRSSASDMLSLNACRTFRWRLIDPEFFLDIWARVTVLGIIRVEMVTKVIGAKETIRETARHKNKGPKGRVNV